MVSKRKIWVLFIVAFIMSKSIQPASAIEVSGDVFGTWGPQNSPYLVMGDLRVPPESSLYIQPGCHIEFQGYFQFKVDSLALLKAIGIEGDSIIFTSDDTITGWHGIRFYFADSTCEIAYSRLQWGRGADNGGLDPTLSNGGAICCQNTKLFVHNSLLQFNRAWEGYGGAIYAGESYYWGGRSSLYVNECTLRKNNCGLGGGAICGEYSDITITNNTISQDSTWYPLGGERGGAIYCYVSSVEITNNIINHNFSGLKGGGAWLPFSNSIVKNNYFIENEAWSSGGGFEINCESSLIVGNIFYGNTCTMYPGIGGGVSLHAAVNGHITFNNNIIVNNYSDGMGGGAAFWGPYNSVENNIIWGNTSYDSSQIFIYGDSSPIIYNDIQGGWTGEGNIDADPLFAGPNDFHLTWLDYPFEDSTKSPCIDAGDPSSPPDSDGSRADIGALPFDRRTYGIHQDPSTLPGRLSLCQNYPNPFNGNTVIEFSLPKEEDINLSVYDILGRKVREVINNKLKAGSYKEKIDLNNASSGVYFCVLQGERTKIIKKMMLIK